MDGGAKKKAKDLLVLKLDELVLDPVNVRLHSDRNVAFIESLLERFGQQSPIVIDAEKIVRKGNGTVMAARRLRERGAWPDTIECLRTTLTDPNELRAYAIADNRASDLSEFDEEKLAIELHGLKDADLVGVASFNDADLHELDQLLAPSMPGSKRALSGFKNVPVVRIVIAVSKLERFERAMQATGEMNRETALLKISESYLHANGSEER